MFPYLNEDGLLIPPVTREAGVQRVKDLRQTIVQLTAIHAKADAAGEPFIDEIFEKLKQEELQLSAWLMGWKAATDHYEIDKYDD